MSKQSGNFAAWPYPSHAYVGGLWRRSALSRKVPTLACCFLFLFLLCNAPCSAATLKAAVAKVDITPPIGLPMYGFLDRIKEGKVSTGVSDPLYARVLILEVSEKRLALVTLDLGRTFNAAGIEWLRKAIAASSGISFLIVNASHTHSGPNLLDEYPSGQAPAWEIEILNKIAATVHEASGRLVEAHLGTGYGSVYIGYNRRVVSSDGRVTMLWSNPGMEPTSPLDPRVSVLRVDDTGGKPLAILVNYACHPVVLGADNTKYSADFVAVMASTVEAALEGSPICFFLQGGDGDINPYYATTPLREDATAKRDWTGRRLGEEAARIARTIRTEASSPATIDFTDDVINFPLRWDATTLRDSLLKTFGPRIFEDHAGTLVHDPPPDHLELHVITLLLGKRIAFVGMPGEPFVNFQINWRDRCPVPDVFFLGYTNGYFDYLPTIDAAAEGGYGAADSNTYLEVGAGEQILRHALVRVYEMLGRLKDEPEKD
ncbi:MAG: hypothetical protein DMG77_15780 [Acidobacteria bacterium]|nr:MAG: hypothetical protein DMG77_15780 [Acidobacteriota bacterium]